MAATQTTRQAKTKALALPRRGFLDEAEEALYEAGLYGGGDDGDGHYEAVSTRVGAQILPAIRSRNDDREALGEIAKQLVIAGIPFRLVTVR